MTYPIHPLLQEPPLSLRHDKFLQLLIEYDNLLIIQDLDGVCMGLVKDPLTREMAVDYVQATRAFDGHFFVLTNGEHIGQRGVNGIIERAVGDAETVQQEGWYLPGLAAGGVQWQDRFGNLDYPGVSQAELDFLSAVPDRIRDRIHQFFTTHTCPLSDRTLQACIDASALDNQASPTANLNTFYDQLRDTPDLYTKLQYDMQQLMDQLLQEAHAQGLSESFFVHYAPNLGRDADGLEILWPSDGNDSGTTDFQFMLRGAVKEAGVPAILNRYYHQRTGKYPLGEDFNARQAPSDHHQLIELVKSNFDPAHMPVMIGVGDTVTSKGVELEDGSLEFRRGGSDRNFLQLIQDIGLALDIGNIVAYVDSSGGEVKNRKTLPIDHSAEPPKVLEGPGDTRDVDDPLTLSIVFPGGYQEYTALFQQAAAQRLSIV